MIEIIKRPLLTEKAMKFNEQGQYVFEVIKEANKIEIKKAIEEMFEVSVINVRTTILKGKVKSRMTKRGVMRGTTPSRKKAFVTLKKGDSIELVSGASGS